MIESKFDRWLGHMISNHECGEVLSRHSVMPICIIHYFRIYSFHISNLLQVRTTKKHENE